MHSYIDSARILGSKNLDGRLTVASAPGLPFLLQEGMTVHFVPPVIDAPRNARIAALSMQGNGSAIVRFEGIDSVDVAEMLVGCHCLVARDAIDDELLEQLQLGTMPAFEGWSFVDEASGSRGIIEYIDEMPGQMMLGLALEGDKGSTKMVPLVDEFIVSEDECAKMLTLALPLGILDL